MGAGRIAALLFMDKFLKVGLGAGGSAVSHAKSPSNSNGST